MTIKEQIEIARMIASGTPREVAILEFTDPNNKYTKKSGAANPDNQGDAKNKIVKTKPTPKPSKNDAAKKRALDAKEKQDGLAAKAKEIRDRQKVERLRRTKHKTRNAVANAIKKAEYSKARTTAITTKGDEGATAVQQAAGNVAKTGAAATKNVVKGLAKAVVGARNLKRGYIGKYSDRAIARDSADNVKKQYEKNNPKKEKKGMFSQFRKEEFIQEIENKKDSKAKKVIDIMRGKNSIKINPDVKEDTVVVQDASGKDFVEIVDIITPQKVRSDWRKEINVTEASAAWTRKEGKSKSGGLNEKGRKSYERQNPGSDLKAPSKKVGNKRRASFCARMKGMKKKLTSKKTASDPDSRINKSLRAWNC